MHGGDHSKGPQLTSVRALAVVDRCTLQAAWHHCSLQMDTACSFTHMHGQVGSPLPKLSRKGLPKMVSVAA